MIKIAIKKENAFRKALTIPVLKSLIVFHISHLNQISRAEMLHIALSRIVTPNKTHKTTHVNRFANLDQWILPYIKPDFKIHDVAVSDGTTTLELYNTLSKQLQNIKLYYSDKYSVYYLIKGIVERIYDSNGGFVHAYLGFLYIDKKIKWYFFLSKLSGYLFRDIADPKHSHKRISLFNRDLVELGASVKELEYDIFNSTSPIKFDLVRAMNILNLAYFPSEVLMKGLENISNSLSEGGYLLIGRTVNEQNNTGLYQKRGNQLVLIDKLNSGSEMDSIINLYNSRS